MPSIAGASAIPREIDVDLAAMPDDPAEIGAVTAWIIDRRGGTGAGSPGIRSNLVGVTDDPVGIVGTPAGFVA